MTRRALVALVLAACAKRAEPTVETTQTLELEGIRVSVPSSWSTSPKEQSDRLAAASRRRDPAADVKVIAVGAEASRSPAVALAVLRHSPQYTRDATARSAILDGETVARDAARARGTKIDSTHTCGERDCTWRMTIQGEAAVHTRVRMWRAEGRLVQVSCMGTDRALIDSCELPGPPPNADAVR
jgi:hypothetical protein